MLMNLLKRIPGSRKLVRQDAVLSQPKSDPREFLLEMLPKNSICAEIGVHKGDFSAQILQTVIPKELSLIDPWKYEDSDTYKQAWYGGQVQDGQNEMDDRYQAVCLRFDPQVRSGRIKIYRGCSGDVLGKFPDQYFDWVYIDGNHLYEFAKLDLELSLKKTKINGFIMGDDYAEGGWWLGGVKKAVDEFIQQKQVRLVMTQDRQFVLQNKRAEPHK